MRQKLMMLLLALAVLNPTITEIASVAATNGSNCPVKISPGRIMPQGYNHYLETPEAQVKLEYPRAIVLQNTTGDMLFNVTTRSANRTFSIYIPNEFGVKTDRKYIWTSITNNYQFISISRLSGRDPIAPKWFRVIVYNGTSNILPGSHLIRLFNVTAPGIVGRYFFKIFIDGNSIGADCFPTLVVSADPNPAYVSGTVVDCSSSFFRHKYGYMYEYAYAYGSPIELKGSEGGKVVAEGVATDGRRVVGQAYFNASAAGRYTLYGLTSGTYNLTAYAAGYSPTPMVRLVRVLAGQSLDEVNLCIVASPRIEGVVWSKCGGIQRQWGPIATRVGPSFGAALVHIGSSVFPGRDLIYALRGANTSDFYRYDTITNAWEPKQPTPGPIGPGGSLAFESTLQYIYALQGGGSNTFWVYDVANDAWQNKSTTPASVGEGGSLAYGNGILYALRGGGAQDFWRYVPTLDIWEVLDSTPSPVRGGGSLTFNTNDAKVYAFQGGGSNAFWRYDPTTNTWDTSLSSLPGVLTAKSGASLAFSSSNNNIYALIGGNAQDFLQYQPSSNSWLIFDPTNIPVNVGPGGSLTFDNLNGFFYALVGGGAADLYEYSVSSDSWNAQADFPLSYPRPITIEILDSIDNSLRLLEGLTDPASYSFAFTYDGTIELDGHIPQDGSGYVSGIGLGVYKVRVWVNEYVQPNDAVLVLSNNMAVTRIEFDVQRAGRAEVLVHFRDFLQGQLTQVIPGRLLTVALYDRDNILRGRNSTIVASGSTSSGVIVTGFLGTLYDYGLPRGTYNVRVTIEGFYQPFDFYLTISDCSAVSKASLDVVRTGRVLLTIRSVNSQSPPQPQNWRYPGSPIRVEIRDRDGAIVYRIALTRQIPSRTEAPISATDLRAGTYTIYLFTFGYFQKDQYLITLLDGVTVDRVVNLVVGGTIEVNVLFEKEDLPAGIDTYRLSYRVPIRIEVYDAYYDFVAANATYVISSSTMSTFRLAGFRRYAGNSSWRWVNFYDTTDGRLQSDSGLVPGSYWVLVYLPGFMQDNVVTTITLPEGGSSSLTIRLNRLAHLFGTVTSLNMFGEVVPLNWAIVDAIGSRTKDFTPTMDGFYEMWLEDGHYLVVCSLNGYDVSTKEAHLSKGSDVPVDFRLRTIGISIPEFGGLSNNVPVVLVMACIASILFIRKFRNGSALSGDKPAHEASPQRDLLAV